MARALSKLELAERYNLGTLLRYFIKTNPSLENETGYSEAHMLKVVTDWQQHGSTSDTDETNLLLLLVRLAF